MAKIPQNHRKAWSQNDIQKLQNLANKNTPTGLIAHQLGRSKASISSQANKQNISLKPTNKSPYDRKFSEAKKNIK